jgi:hypothetical protein
MVVTGSMGHSSSGNVGGRKASLGGCGYLAMITIEKAFGKRIEWENKETAPEGTRYT